MLLQEISEKIYVVNLKKRKDRLHHITNELQKINCSKYEIVEAIDGSQIDNPTKMKNGNYGLNLTYIKIHEDWSKNKTQTVLIIEDDCCFSDNFNDELKNYIENIPKDWDIIYFGANHNYHIGYQTEKINEFCKKLTNSICAHIVIMKNYVFEELIQEIKKNKLENDVILSNLQKKYNAYSPNNRLTKQLENFSDIEGSITNYDKLIN
jgi:GR25 family glycosyltransferase involved in LPS biosynthesis